MGLMPKKEKKTTIKIPTPKKTGITGKTSFRTGVIKTRKDRVKNRKDKYAKREKRDQLEGE